MRCNTLVLCRRSHPLHTRKARLTLSGAALCSLGLGGARRTRGSWELMGVAATGGQLWILNLERSRKLRRGTLGRPELAPFARSGEGVLPDPLKGPPGPGLRHVSLTRGRTSPTGNTPVRQPGAVVFEFANSQNFLQTLHIRFAIDPRLPPSPLPRCGRPDIPPRAHRLRPPPPVARESR